MTDEQLATMLKIIRANVNRTPRAVLRIIEKEMPELSMLEIKKAVIQLGAGQ